MRPDPDQLADPLAAAKLALRSLARRIALLDEEIVELDTHLKPLVATAAPRTIALLGISTGHAGQLLITAGQTIDRRQGVSFRPALTARREARGAYGSGTRALSLRPRPGT